MILRNNNQRNTVYRVVIFAIAALIIFPTLSYTESVSLPEVIKSFQEELKDASKLLIELDSRINKDMSALQRDANSINLKRDQVVLLFSSAQDPWDLRDALEANANISDKIKKILVHPETMNKELASYILNLQEMKERIVSRSQEDGLPPVADKLNVFLKEIDSLIIQGSNVVRIIESGTSPVKELLHRIDSESKKISESIRKNWIGYYTHKISFNFSFDVWELSVYSVTRWLKWIKFTATIAANMLGMTDALLAMLKAVGVAMCVGAFWSLLFRLRQIQRGSNFSKLMLFRAAVCTSCAAGVMGASTELPPVVFSIVMSFAEILFAAGLVFLSKYFTSIHPTSHAEPKTATRWPLWLIFSLGLLLNSLRVPDVLVQPILIFSLVFIAWKFHYCSTALEKTIDIIIYKVSIVVLGSLTMLSIYGYCRITILIVSCLFYFVLCVRFSNALCEFLDVWQKSRQRIWSPFFKGLVAGTSFPLVFLCSFLLCLWLMSVQFEGQIALGTLLSYEVRLPLFSLTLGKLTFMILGYYLVRSAERASRELLTVYGKNNYCVESGTILSLQNVIFYAWWGGYCVAMLCILGISFTSFAVIAGGLSVGIGFGLQHIVNNFISGVLLIFGKTAEVGDVLQINDTTGTVRRVSMLNTTIQTSDNATIFIPNATLVSSQIINWSHRDRSVRRDITVSVKYGSEVGHVSTLLIQAALSVADVLAEPAPSVVLNDFGQQGLDLKLRVWIADVSSQQTVLSEVRLAVTEILREHGVEIARPWTEVQLSADTHAGAV